MLQSQIQSARCNAKGTAPGKGVRIRDYPLADALGSSVELSSFRGKHDLVILFCGRRVAAEQIASRLAAFDDDFAEKNALVVLVVAGEPAWVSGSRLLIASDIGGVAHKEIGANGAQQSCFITDQFGEVYAALSGIPPVEEILSWLDFINSQCPECEPPEWPVEA